MTREEAIRCLSVHSSTNGSGLCTDKQHYEAKQTAIKALEQEPKTDVLDKIRAEIEQYETDCMFADTSKECKECDRVMFGTIYRIIDKYKKESEGAE